MASTLQKQEICDTLRKILLRVCKKVVPFHDLLELHGLLLLETDGKEFCTISFKDVKVKARTVEENSRSRSKSLTCDSTESGDQFRRFSHSPNRLIDSSCRSRNEVQQDGDESSGVVNWAVQDALDIWQGMDRNANSEVAENHRVESNNELSGSVQNVTNENSDVSWNHLNRKPEKNKNNRFECPVCSKEFSFATNLTRHQRTNHGRPQLRKPLSGNKKVQKERKQQSKVSSEDVSNSSIVALTENNSTVMNKDDRNNNLDTNSGLYSQEETSEYPNNPAERTILEGQSDIDSIRSPDHSTSFLQSSSYTDQVSMSMDIGAGNSYMSTTFPNEEMYFSLPETMATPEPAPRLFQSLTVTPPETGEFQDHNLSRQNSILSQNPCTFQPTSATETVNVPQIDNNIQDNNTFLSQNNVSPVTVPQDNTVYKTKAGKEYINIENSTNPPAKHTCPVCQRKFDLYQNLGRHSKVSHGKSIFELEMQHRDKTETPPDSTPSGGQKKNLKCDICGHCFTFRSNLCRHKSKHHGMSTKLVSTDKKKLSEYKKISDKDPDCDDSQKDPKDSPVPKHKCDICSALFKFTSSLSRHMRRKHNLIRANMFKPTSPKSSKSNSTLLNPLVSRVEDRTESTERVSAVNDNASLMGRPEQFAIPLTGLHPYSDNSNFNRTGNPCSNSKRDKELSQVDNFAAQIQNPTSQADTMDTGAGKRNQPASIISATHSQQGDNTTNDENLNSSCLKLPANNFSLDINELAVHKVVASSNSGMKNRDKRSSSGAGVQNGKVQKNVKEKQSKDSRHHSSKDKTAGKSSNNSPKDKKTQNGDKSSLKKRKSLPKSPTETDKNKCNICDKKFSFRTNLTRHTRNMHGTYPGGPEDSLSPGS